MPTYVYRCKNCEHQFEVVQRISDEPLRDCPECGGTIGRLLFPVGIVFKGSGFHVNDYPSSRSSGGNGRKTDEKSQSKSESKETISTSKD